MMSTLIFSKLFSRRFFFVGANEFFWLNGCLCAIFPLQTRGSEIYESKQLHNYYRNSWRGAFLSFTQLIKQLFYSLTFFFHSKLTNKQSFTIKKFNFKTMTEFSVNTKPDALVLPVGTVQKEWRATFLLLFFIMSS